MIELTAAGLWDRATCFSVMPQLPSLGAVLIIAVRELMTESVAIEVLAVSKAPRPPDPDRRFRHEKQHWKHAKEPRKQKRDPPAPLHHL